MTIPQRVLAEIFAHAREVHPRECCGILVGGDDAIFTSVRAQNLASAPSKFLIDPRDHIRVLREARAQEREVVGFYHSHPHSLPIPSPTDIAEASYPECVHLIAGWRQSEPEARLFRIVGGQVEAVELRVVGDQECAG